MDNNIVVQPVRNWGWLLIALGLLFGLVTLFITGTTIRILIAVFGIYVVMDGIAQTSSELRACRTVLFAEGWVTVAAGLMSLVLPSEPAFLLLFLWAAWALITGALEISAALPIGPGLSSAAALLTVAAVLSGTFAVILAFTSGSGAVVWRWVIGIYAIGLGGSIMELGSTAPSDSVSKPGGE